MKQVLLQNNAVRSIETYIEQYWLYYYERFHDTGLFGLDEILVRYWDESIERKDDIRNTLEKRLTPDVVLGRTPGNTLFIPWRQKRLFIAWRDEGDNRIVTDLIIR